MQRRDFLKKTGLTALVGTAAVGAPAIAASTPEVRWQMASSYMPSLQPIYSAAELFCDMVKELTDGKFTIRLYPAGTLVPGFSILDAVGNGTVHCGQTASYYYFGNDPALCFDTAVPFGLNARQMNAWMYEGDGMKLMRELFASYNIINFPLGNTGTQMGGWFRKEINSVADLKGLKMRTAGFAGEVLSHLGVIPQQIPPSDIYPALEKGALDAVELVGPVDDENYGFQKVAKYYYYPGWWEGSAQVSLYVNDKAFNELPKVYQAVVRIAARAASTKSLETYDAHNAAALRRLISKGTIMKNFPREVMDACYEASTKTYEKFCADSPGFKKIHDNYMGFRNEVVPWFRVAEGSYDSYLSTVLPTTRK